MTASWFFYSHPEFLPKQQVNQGKLINPQHPVIFEDLKTIDGHEFSVFNFDGMWTLVKLNEGDCSKTCQQDIYDFNQIRLALGEDMHFLQRILVLTGTVITDEYLKIISKYPNMLIITETQPSFNDLFSNFANFEEINNNGIYLIDPKGNLMMHYSHEISSKNILKDIERLIMATKNWLG
jgi:cytochrome oxidase Cu insertion factor (SCO1/SenC/PrrC family)